VVAEDVSSSGERRVRGQDDGGVLVATGDELEKQVRCFGVEGDVAYVVDDQQRVAAQSLQLRSEAPCVVVVNEAGDPVGRRSEEDAVSLLGCSDA
jgi:hypothetical protein